MNQLLTDFDDSLAGAGSRCVWPCCFSLLSVIFFVWFYGKLSSGAGCDVAFGELCPRYVEDINFFV